MKKLLFLLFSPLFVYSQDKVIEKNPEGVGWLVVESRTALQEEIFIDLSGKKFLTPRQDQKREIFGQILSADERVPQKDWVSVFEQKGQLVVYNTTETSQYLAASLWLKKQIQQNSQAGFYNPSTESIEYRSGEILSKIRLAYEIMILMLLTMVLSAIFAFYTKVNINEDNTTTAAAGAAVVAVFFTAITGVITQSWGALFFVLGLGVVSFLVIYLLIGLYAKRKTKGQIEMV